jgi:PHD finger-like domain-containing protein 5A
MTASSVPVSRFLVAPLLSPFSWTPFAGDGLCCVCQSFVNPTALVHVCDECNYGSNENRCVICSNPGVTDAYYCRECVQLEKDRDGCPKIVNLGSTKTDMFYERKKYGFKKR